ncbi:VOC family protein [Mucilaginibacter sp. BJC16-A38]|uniref:VOC family protein n=1 Tax=Mucilaginibacter phenanthrenivorans TaxID=1234842 RepID=UPI002157B6AD|nr:VOC family protein [Mucilaginibacter phenanthrenivorans]MCR8560329.1 VOC family protein [Mucilaginibacter phenanthrenivorans]
MNNKIIKNPAKNPDGINGKMKFEHAALRTTDYETTIQWYIDKLGFRLVDKWVSGDLLMAYVAPANDDDFWLEIIQGPIPAAYQDYSLPIVSGFHHFSMTVESVDETIEALRQRGINITREPFNLPVIGKRIAFIADLHGNSIEFTENI